MRIDVSKIPFSGISNNQSLAKADCSDCLYVAFVVKVDAITGAPASIRVRAFSYDDQTLGGGLEHIRQTEAVGGIATFILSRRQSEYVEPAFPANGRVIDVVAQFTGGVAPTISGYLYVFRKRR